jgi:hypothetical protein
MLTPFFQGETLMTPILPPFTAFDRYELAREFVSAMLSCAPANADQVAIITTAVAMADLLISKLSAE